MTLEPAGRVEPALAPGIALDAAPLPSLHGTSITLATVHDPLEGVALGPAWVIIARGLCIRDAKGELVSDARGNDPNGLACTDDTFQVIALDADSGRTLVNTTGYDETRTWVPDVARQAAV